MQYEYRIGHTVGLGVCVVPLFAKHFHTLAHHGSSHDDTILSFWRRD